MANGLFGGGNGSYDTPYLVEDFADINAIKNYVTKPNVHFEQVNDIEFEGFDTWTPIGDTGVGPFMGTYDGGNHKIKGVVVEARREDLQVGGLFGFTYGGSHISNIHMQDATVTGTNDVGGIVGMNQGVVLNCSFTGSVEGKNRVGGISGLMQFNVTKCSVRGSVTGETNVGGIAGSATPTTSTSNAKDSYCLADVTATASTNVAAGGIIGLAMNSDVVHSYFGGNLSTPNTSELTNVGGILGQVDGGKVVNSYYNSEKVDASNSYGTGISTADLANQETFVDWNFETIWSMESDYPVIMGQPNFGAPVFAEGDGTKENPYRVTTAQELQSIVRMTAGSNYFLQMNDIDLTDFGLFTPIGNGGAPFFGIYDGGGFKVINLTVEKADSHNGLFGYSKGIVKNVHVTGQLNVGDYTGGIVGMNNGTISDCSFDGTIIGMEYVGGLCGMNFGTVLKSCSSGYVQANDTVGGLIGMQSTEGALTEDSYSTADVKITPEEGAISATVAGLVGGFYTGTIRRVFAIGSIDSLEVPDSVSSFKPGALTGPIYGQQVIEDAYYDLDKFGKTSPTGTGKLTMQFAQQETFPTFDFDNVWQMGEKHPRLMFEDIPRLQPSKEAEMYSKIAGTWYRMKM